MHYKLISGVKGADKAYKWGKRCGQGL
jgi:hypothetical protein